MERGKGTGASLGEMVASAEERQRDTERAAQLLGQAEEELGVVVQEVPLSAIEPDPMQPRRFFDEEKLKSLAASIQKYGLLQEPGVVPVTSDTAGLPTRFRLIWGERRWRACSLAGLQKIRCKVLPRADDTAAEQLRTKEKQWAENVEREGLSPIEEAIAIQDAIDVERSMNLQAPVGELVEKVGAQRGLNGMVARNLVSLLKAPRCLQTAMMARAIGREVGFELARHWNRLLEQHELHGALKREFQFRNLVTTWATARGLELNVETMTKYAAETFQDPKVVKATCRKAEESQRAVLERFKALVERAQKQKWTVAKAKAVLSSKNRTAADEESPQPLFVRAGRGNTRLTIYLDRIRDSARGAVGERAELVALLREIIQEIEPTQAAESTAILNT